jgi:hypothetical protein
MKVARIGARCLAGEVPTSGAAPVLDLELFIRAIRRPCYMPRYWFWRCNRFDLLQQLRNPKD